VAYFITRAQQLSPLANVWRGSYDCLRSVSVSPRVWVVQHRAPMNEMRSALILIVKKRQQNAGAHIRPARAIRALLTFPSFRYLWKDTDIDVVYPPTVSMLDLSLIHCVNRRRQQGQKCVQVHRPVIRIDIDIRHQLRDGCGCEPKA
jgi:hypothetical protein